MKDNSQTISLKATSQPVLLVNAHINELYEMVKEFHQVFGHSIDSTEITPAMLRLRANLIREEADEGLKAIDESDYTEVFDAVGDTVYVLSGTLVMIANSMSHALSFDHIAAGSMYKTVIADFTASFFDDLKAGFNLSIATAEYLEEIANCLESKKGIAACETLSSLPYYISDCLALFNHALDANNQSLPELTQVIHESNMSKLWSSDAEERKRQVENCKYDPADLAFRPCLTRDGVIGYRISDDKILKSPSYTPVDLSKFADKWDY
ncbi:nucleoside triphosphate pyrophosphohydrolase family protein [Xenorhabdus hominickii]|uniref:Phosphoribosyl-ATP pyrophosphohydrolase n=1 Tax=Xenorhabdus hominickii TaxID=351679 RepID=A0A1V0M421_XENHO|nr:nucleoside triphosphate pyrophosphohydrolase family protein [Xenorhabdus hominickii]ARD69616.1 Phosphoribosyl-ATP pyrophosphohydrolase [Xenorhabdus hominickii]PHM52330.1 hypothetical protein Xhom_04407 [Xenorhabdus hominickii]